SLMADAFGRLRTTAGKHVVIAGAGLAGLSAAKYLADQGFDVTLLEKRPVAGGKVSSWQDADGDWLESGLHVFFGAYHNLLAFLRETGLDDALTWMPHALTFSQPGGVLSPLAFPDRIPAPFHGLTAIARNRGVLTNPDKLRTGLGLLWPILGNQAYIDRQDHLTYEQWHARHGLSRRSIGDFFDTMLLALNFSRSSEVSAKLLLTVLSHFGKETGASRVAFLKGPPETRLFRPLLSKLQAVGVDVRFNAKVRQVRYDPVGGVAEGFELTDGSTVRGDVYVSAMPAHNLWKTLPPPLREMKSLAGLRHLHGVPVMTVQLYFDRPVTGVKNLVFSSRSHISVYAELGQICPDFYEGVRGRSMVELVVAPAAQWFKLTDAEVVARVMEEFAGRHPLARQARLLKSTVVRIPQSVYKARPGMDRCRPDQATGIPNFFVCGDYTRQEYLASMEGAVLSGKRVTSRILQSVASMPGGREVALGV
ncbi:MAG TPA: FAD-dependent oxidoreductase, partial [Chloroflexia bacterium]|nr:FAD-dependent oxidoreductase [Chloroflexia bacterium]